MNNPMTKSTAIVFTVLGLLILGVLVFLTYPKSTVAPTGETATTTASTTTSSAEGTKPSVPAPVKPAVETGTIVATPAVGLSKVLQKDASGVSLYAGVDPAGRTVYKLVPGVDVASFKALTELDAIEHPTEKKGTLVTSLGAGSVAYYKDKNVVYVLSVFESTAQTKVAIEVIQDADSATFAPLANPWYSKDKTHIFRIEAPTNDAPHAIGAYAWQPYDAKAITNVDVASFALVSNSSVTYDAHDKTHAYRKGIEVGTYPE